MPRFSEVTNDGTPAHLLLCGDTKTGKSDYVARAVLDGYYCLYFDSDNGGGTLSQVIPVGHEARRRLIYFPTKNPYSILKGFTETGVFRWNITSDKEFNGPIGHDPDDIVAEIRPGRIPQGFLVVFDSWTSVSIDCMRVAAKDNKVKLTDMGREKRAVYGDSSIRLNSALDILQSIRPHLIVQAHGQFYERKEKPKGVVEDIKEYDMIVKENVLVPVSCSQPHGHGMGKFFNQIGWMTVNQQGKRILDFDVKSDRIGGGSVTGSGDPHTAYSFASLFGKEPKQFTDEEIEVFYKEYPVRDYVAPNATSKPAASPAAPTGNLSPVGTPTSGTQVKSLLLKRN